MGCSSCSQLCPPSSTLWMPPPTIKIEGKKTLKNHRKIFEKINKNLWKNLEKSFQKEEEEEEEEEKSLKK